MRPDLDRYFIDMTRLVASRSTCVRRHVGCVLIDARNHVLATGYNGVPARVAHCNEPLVTGEGLAFPHACAGADAESGKNLDACLAIHAEQNAVLQCRDVYAIAKAYVTDFPCVSCAKLLLNTGCLEIVYAAPYSDSAGLDLWRAAGRLAVEFQGEPPMIQRDLVRLFGPGDPLNEWRVLVACICLNLCSARVARCVVMRILNRWPSPTRLAAADDSLEGLLKPLGLAKRRGVYLRAMSANIGRVGLSALPGVGAYAVESVRVFCRNEIPAKIGDRKVAAWVNWQQKRSRAACTSDEAPW